MNLQFKKKGVIFMKKLHVYKFGDTLGLFTHNHRGV